MSRRLNKPVRKRLGLGKWRSLLQRRVDVSFPGENLEALRFLQGIQAGSEEARRIANELEAEGYAPIMPEWYRTHPERLKGNEWYLWHYRQELLYSMWPEPVAHALWDKNRVLTHADAEALIGFLEVDPYFFRSGYAKPTAIRRLGRCNLTRDQRLRIVGILRQIVMSGWERNVKDWRKLARLCEPGSLDALIRDALLSRRDAVMKRATLLGLTLLGQTNVIGRINSRWGPRTTWDEAIALVREKFEA